MTNDNNTRKKANAVFFSVLMVISMVAVGFAAAPAAANATNVTADSAEDVTINPSGTVTQDVTYNVTFDGANPTENVTISTSDIPSAVLQSATTNVDNAAGSGITHDETTISGQTITVDFSAANNGSSYTADFTTTITHNTSGLGAGNAINGAEYTIADTASTNSDTVSFDLRYNNADAERVAEADEAFNGSTVYQGEDDLTFIDNDGSTVSPGALQKTSGDAAGTALNLPIADDAATGTYAESGSATAGNFRVIVQEPRITTAEVQLNGDDISRIASSRATPSNGLSINSSWNFGEAENVEITVEDSSGTDITGEVVGNDVLTGGTAGVGLDLSDEEAGDYTIIFEASDDISIEEEYTITTTNQDSISVDVDGDTVTQGNNVPYTVSGGTNADFHLVTVSGDDLRQGGFDGNDYQRVFRNVEDTSVTGVYDGAQQNRSVDASALSADDIEYAFAIVEVDGTQAVGSINSRFLDDTSVDVRVYGQSSNTGIDNLTDVDTSSLTEQDDDDFDVEEGDVTLSSPTDTYTTGSEVDVNGSAPSSDEVAIYARDNGDWQPVNVTSSGNTITVDSDDTFEEEDVAISQLGARGNNILSFEGRYTIGAIDAADARDEVGDTQSPLTTSQFSQGASTRSSITVEAGDLSAEFGTVNGQISTDDNVIDVDGSAAGQDQVVIAFVDRRGNTQVATPSVDDDDTFEEEEIDLSGLDQGTVTGHVISLGRDGDVGDGDGGSTGNTVSSLATYINTGVSGSGDQVRSRILSNTVDADGSDDLIVSESFRLADSTLRIDNVYPEEAQADGVNPVATGETLVVEGTTNRQSDNAAIIVEMLDDDQNALSSGDVSEWENDGQWSATIDTSDLETGTYTLEADDGDSTDRVEVELVEERQTDDGDDGEDGDDGSTDGDDGSTDGDDGSSDGDDGSMDGDDGGSDGEDGGSDGGDGGTDDSTPGFGALVALVALIAAALLATRRND